MWWIVGALCVGFHAILLQQRQYNQQMLQKLQVQLDEAEQRATQQSHIAELFDFSKRSAREIMSMGQLFFDYKSTYHVLDDDLREKLHEEHNDTVIEPMEYLTDLGSSARVSAGEKAAGQLYPTTVRAMVSRLKEAGVLVIPSLHDPERCRRLAHSVHRDIRVPWVEYG